MTNRRNFALWLLCIIALLAASLDAEVVDRIIAVVNTRLITWSDLDQQMRFEALENGRPLGTLSEADRHTAFDHLVQYRILRGQMQGTAPASVAEVDSRIGDLRTTLHMQDDADWTAALLRYGLSAAEMRELLTNQIEILKFIEFRVRPLVRVTRQEVDDYYSLNLVPQVVARGQVPEPLEQVTPAIRELLTEQKVNKEMEKWLAALRSQSSVEILWDPVR